MARTLLKVLAAALAGATMLSAAAEAQQPVRIGIAVSRTGNLADSAEHYWKGLELWAEQANARGGLLGRKIEFVQYDDRSDPATAARLYERLITNDNVDLLIAPMGSAATATATPVAEKHKRVIINGIGASEKIHQRGFKYVFQTSARISAYVDGAGPLAEKTGLKSMAIISRDYSAARDMAEALQKMSKEKGVKITETSYFPAGTADFASNIAAARQAQPEMWISVGYPNEAIEMVRQFRASNYVPKVFIHNGVSQEDFIKAAGKDGEYAMGMSLYEPILKTKGNEQFVKTFSAKYNYEPGYYSGFGFAAATVLEQAVAKAGSLDQEKLREVLTTLETETVLGKHKVDPSNGMQLGVRGLLVQVLKGKREVVWPDDLKSAEPVVPMPAWSAR